MSLVIDTNVLVSWVIANRKESTISEVMNHIFRYERVCFSHETLDELGQVLNRPKFDRYVSRERRRAFFLALMEVSFIVEVTEKTNACRDAKDNKFLDVALNGNASALISGDDDLLVLHPFQKINILSPAAFLATVRN